MIPVAPPARRTARFLQLESVDMTESSALPSEKFPGGQDVLFDAKKCFIAAPIGSAESEVRRRSDLVRKYIIDEALQPLGYETVRSDDIEKAGEITTQIVSDLIEADLVIADLTGQNANVFYELAIRHSFRKPYIQIVEKGEELPFDVRAFRTVFVDHKDLESAALARRSLHEMIKDIEDGGDVQSPVTHAVTRQQLESSQDPGGKELAQVAEVVERIEARMRRLESDDKQIRRGNLERQAVFVLMSLLEDAIVKKKLITGTDFDELDTLSRSMPDLKLQNFVKYMKDNVVPF